MTTSKRGHRRSRLSHRRFRPSLPGVHLAGEVRGRGCFWHGDIGYPRPIHRIPNRRRCRSAVSPTCPRPSRPTAFRRGCDAAFTRENSSRFPSAGDVRLTIGNDLLELIEETPMTTNAFTFPPHHMTGREWTTSRSLRFQRIAPLGPHVDAFEREMADLRRLSPGVGASSETAALHWLSAAGVERGDRVFCSDLTFAARSIRFL